MVDRIESSKAANLCSKLIDAGFDAKLTNLFAYSYDKDYSHLCIVIEIGKAIEYGDIAKIWEIAGADSYYIEIGKKSRGGFCLEIAKPWEFAEFVESESVKCDRELRPTQTVYTHAAWNDYHLNFIA